jgi:hypothetical protein
LYVCFLIDLQENGGKIQRSLTDIILAPFPRVSNVFRAKKSPLREEGT